MQLHTNQKLNWTERGIHVQYALYATAQQPLDCGLQHASSVNRIFLSGAATGPDSVFFVKSPAPLGPCYRHVCGLPPPCTNIVIVVEERDREEKNRR